MEKLTISQIRKMVLEEALSFDQVKDSDSEVLLEKFDRDEKRELSRIIRNEIARLFYDLFKKRSFWTK